MSAYETDSGKFYQAMMQLYKKKAERIGNDNSVVWDIAIELLAEIKAASSDGSSMGDLGKLADKHIETLKALLDA